VLLAPSASITIERRKTPFSGCRAVDRLTTGQENGTASHSSGADGSSPRGGGLTQRVIG